MVLKYKTDVVTQSDYPSIVIENNIVTINITGVDSIDFVNITHAFALAKPIKGTFSFVFKEQGKFITKLSNTNLFKLGFKLDTFVKNEDIVILIKEYFNAKELSSFITLIINAINMAKDSKERAPIDVFKYLNKQVIIGDRYKYDLTKMSYEEQLILIMFTHNINPNDRYVGATQDTLMKITNSSRGTVDSIINKYAAFLSLIGNLYYMKADYRSYFLIESHNKFCPELATYQEVDILSSIDKKMRSKWLERLSELA